MSDFTAWVNKLIDMTSDEIAILCKEEDIKGHPYISTMCPVAILLATKTTCIQPLVGPDNVYDENFGYNEAIKVKGTSISEFVNRFDRGHFPELDIRS